MSHLLTLVSNFRNENPYLAEWIKHHLRIGVDHIHLYDQDGSPEARAIVQPFVASGQVTVHPWLRPERGWDPTVKYTGRTYFFQKNRNHLAYAHAARSTRQRTRWLLKIDVDEFLVPPEGEDGIPTAVLLRWLDRHRAVRLPRFNFGPAGHETKPEGGVRENYRLREEHPSNYKDMANVRFLNGNRFCHSSHRWSYRPTALLPGRRPILKLQASEGLRINHYYTKSRSEYFQRQNICDGRRIESAAFDELVRRLSQVPDDRILRYL